MENIKKRDINLSKKYEEDLTFKGNIDIIFSQKIKRTSK